MAWGIAGVIEGFYGRPWTWAERALVMRECHRWGMTDYLYAPKDDPKHRQAWREPYDADELAGFGGLVEEGTLRVGFGISPGLAIDPEVKDDRRALRHKIEQVLDVGVGLICLALDDIPFGGGDQGRSHATLTTWLRERLADRADLVLVPTEYVGTEATPYLEALAEGVPADVSIGWTGAAVVNDSITAAQASARATALGGRPPLVWDNYPVNDGIMVDRLHLGPLWGRDPALADVCSGYVANPMVQPRASLLPLASTAAFLRGDDPLDAWVAEAERSGLRVLAEACDGAVPQALVQAASEWLDDASWTAKAEPLRHWLEAAAGCEAPGLDGEADAWAAQARDEARLGLSALELLDHAHAGRFEAGIAHAFGVGVLWAAARRAEKSVMGVRYGLQPALGQRGDGTWSFMADSVIEGTNAIDALVRACLAAFAARSQR